MRSVGLGLAFAASVQFVLFSNPAFARQPADTSTPAPATTTTTTTTTTAPATTPATTTTTVVTTPAPATTTGAVTVHIQSTKPVALQRLTSGNSWETVCTSPCDKALPSSDEYQITGEGLNDSKPFMLDTSVGDKVTLDVKPGSKSKVKTGTALLVGGAVLFVGGIVAIAVGSGAATHTVAGDTGSGDTNSKNTNWIFVGTSLIVVGVIGGISGGSLMLDNAHTHVDGPVEAKSDRGNDRNGVKAQVTASRLPTWHEERGPVLAPATNLVPIIHTTF